MEFPTCLLCAHSVSRSLFQHFAGTMAGLAGEIYPYGAVGMCVFLVIHGRFGG